jgi:YVTN family beta-propeller protein
MAGSGNEVHRMNNPRILWFIGATWLLPWPGLLAAGEPGIAGTPARRVRQPVALAVVDGGRTLLVANRRSGSISVVDAAGHRVVAEHDIGRGLSDLTALPDGRHLVALDQAADELMLIDHGDRSIRVVGRIGVGLDPARVVVLRGGSSAVVASTWPRRLTFVGLTPRAPEDRAPALSLIGSLDLPFCPREMAAFADGSRLVVADAFGGRIAVVNLQVRAIESIRSLPAHNIRGLAFTPDGRTRRATRARSPSTAAAS